MQTNLEKEFYLALSRNFKMFIEKCYNEIDGGEKYAETIATDIIADKLLAVQSGEIKRSIINVPPRTLKSTIVSIAFTAWLLGHNPKLKILCISYGDELTIPFSTKTRQIMKSEWYKRTFPKTKFKLFGQKENLIQTTENGFRRAVSIEGSLTGHGADIIIIDDPQKAQEIYSEQTRKKTNEIFSNTIISRLNNKVEGKIIIVAQRLHQDDFSSYVQKYDDWDTIKIPAIAEKETIYKLSDGKTIVRKVGEVINDKIEPLEKLKKLREGMGEVNFSAQYQQEPISPKGNIIKFDDFKYFTNIPMGYESPTLIQSWDCAHKTGDKNDFSVCVSAAIVNDIVYIVDIRRYKLEYPDLLNEIKRMKINNNVSQIIIEDANIGSGIIQQLNREDNIDIIPFRPTGSKADRAACITNLIRDGKVRLLKDANWLEEFAKEVRAFPYGVHDDQVDALVQLLSLFNSGMITPNFCSMIDASYYSVNRDIDTAALANSIIDSRLDQIEVGW